MPTAAELVNPEALASIKAEFHEIFMQKRREVRRLRSAMQVSGSARSERDEKQVASEGGTLSGTKRSRDAIERPIRSLKRARMTEDAPKTSSGITKEPCDRHLWENHAFVELSPTGAHPEVRCIRVGESMHEALRIWKEVEQGMAAYEYVFTQDYDPHAQIIP
jgi:hypothetical protein